MNKAESGIYRIRNVINNKIYIGSAVNFKERVRLHKVHLCKGDHKNHKLQNAWNKYGRKIFEFNLIRIVDDKKTLIKIEQFYLDIYKPHYNICKIAGSSLGVRRSLETKNKIRIAKLGKSTRPHTEETKQKMRDAIKTKMYSFKKGIIPWNKGRKSTIEENLNNSKAHKEQIPWNKGKTMLEKTRLKFCKSVLQFDLKKNFIKKYISTADVQRSLGIWNVAMVCRGERNFAGGYKWKYV